MRQILATIVIMYLTAVTLHIPKEYRLYVTLVGLLGSIVHVLVNNHVEAYIAVLATTITVAIVANIIAPYVKIPVTTFYIPSFMSYVPGSMIYRAMLTLMQQDLEKTNYYLLQAFLMAGSIAFGIFFVDSVVDMLKHIRRTIHLGKTKKIQLLSKERRDT